MTSNLRHAAACALALALSSAAQASQLVYTPVNPSFGGSPLNGTYELGVASANNRFTSPNTSSQSAASAATSSIQSFQQEITSSLLSQIAANIGNTILGEGGGTQQQSGTFNISGLLIQFNRVGAQTNVNITDPTSGGTTQISIPTPNVQY